MLGGCCHCESDPSSSSSSSASSGSSFVGSTVNQNCSRENCISEVFARRYTVTFGYNEPLSCGPSYSLGTYGVEYFYGTGLCAWQSANFGKKGVSCIDIGSRMFTLGMYNTAGTTPSGASAVRYILGVIAQTSGGIDRVVYYGSNLTNVSIFSGAPYSPIDCLHSFTLPITSSVAVQNNFRQAVAGVTTGALLPSSVTITPTP